jgi:Uma2 family endonuclease
MATQSFTEPQVHRWTRSDYYKMAEAGLLEDKHVELIEGQVIEMTPTGSLHATAVVLAARRLERVFGAGYFVRWQMPLAVMPNTELEPDLAIVKGHVRDYKDSHPKTAALIVEVAEASLIQDRTKKAEIYARAGIPDYWILNIPDRQLEVHRNPQLSDRNPSVGGYRDITVLAESGFVNPVAAPDEAISVADLLP